jgi:hypothetical protein
MCGCMVFSAAFQEWVQEDVMAQSRLRERKLRHQWEKVWLTIWPILLILSLCIAVYYFMF